MFHHVNKRLKNIYVQLKPEGVIVKSPGVSQRQAKEILTKQMAWLESKYAQSQTYFQAQSQSENQIMPQQLYLLGKSYRLEFLPGYGQSVLNEEQFICQIYLPEEFHQRSDLVLKILDRLLLAQARDYFQDRMIYWCQVMQIRPRIIRYKYLKSRWGSCSSKDAINLNYRAIQLPPECIDAILVHELAHLTHLNHGKAFWQLVHNYIPDYDLRDIVLKEWAPRLI